MMESNIDHGVSNELGDLEYGGGQSNMLESAYADGNIEPENDGIAQGEQFDDFNQNARTNSLQMMEEGNYMPSNELQTEYVQGSFMEQARDSMINMDANDLANLQGDMIIGDVQTYEYDDTNFVDDGQNHYEDGENFIQQNPVAIVEKADMDT